MTSPPSPPPPRKVLLRIHRQDGADGRPRFDSIEVLVPPGATVHRALVEARRSPTTTDGRRVDPPAWDFSCLEGSCGSCTLRIAGRARLACSTRLSDVAPARGALTIEPLARFPVVRDLVVDRSRQDAALARTDAPSNGAGAEPRAVGDGGGADDPRVAGLLDCIACGACIEACPETSHDPGFVGAEAIARNRLHLLVARASPGARDDLDLRLMQPGGIADCGKAQACSEACPADVPLVEALAHAAGATSRRLLLGWLRR
jgi:succinate dehydrogenase / fumarate reductase iron-sulfur subunit